MHPMKVLIVDDERDIELLFRQKFRKEVRAGVVELCFAFSGEEALASLRDDESADVVLVLSDINMPGMTGLELLREVKSEFSGIRVHMITAYGDEDNYLIRINHSKEEPENAFVAVKYLDYWFYIDRGDIISKRTFTFLMILFSVTETGGKEGLPLVTIPSG